MVLYCNSCMLYELANNYVHLYMLWNYFLFSCKLKYLLAYILTFFTRYVVVDTCIVLTSCYKDSKRFWKKVFSFYSYICWQFFDLRWAAFTMLNFRLPSDFVVFSFEQEVHFYVKVAVTMFTREKYFQSCENFIKENLTFLYES